MNKLNEDSIQKNVISILIKTLNLTKKSDSLNYNSPLLGAIPELDSIAVVSLITALEEAFNFTVFDDEISAEIFTRVGSLIDFVKNKSIN